MDELRSRKTENTMHIVRRYGRASSALRGSVLGVKYSTPTLVSTMYVGGHHLGCIIEGLRPKGELKGATWARRRGRYLGRGRRARLNADAKRAER